MSQDKRRYDGTAASPNDVMLPRARFNELMEAEQRLKKLERRKPAAPTKPAERKLTAAGIDALLDLVVVDGRIGRGDVDQWRRSLEASPAETSRQLAQLPPDADRAALNFMTTPEVEAQLAADLGLRDRHGRPDTGALL